MGKVEDCVGAKLSQALSPGEEPTEQELAIKFSECRDEHPGGDKGFGDSTEVLDNGTYMENTIPAAREMFANSPDYFASYKKKDNEINEDLSSEIAQSMHEKHFEQPLIDEESSIEMIEESKYFSGENKDTVLGMAFNFYEKVFVGDDVAKGNSFSNDVAQEMYEATKIIMAHNTFRTVTKEFIALELTRQGFDAVQAHDFVQMALELEDGVVAPDVVDIPQTEDKDLEVPNMNAKNNFVPDDTLFGGMPREELGVDKIEQDAKPNLGTKVSPKDPNEIDDQGAANIRDKDTKRSGNQDGWNDFTDSSEEFMNYSKSLERVHHVANSVMSSTPDPMTQELGPCEPGSVLNPVTGQCDKVTMSKVNNLDGAIDPTKSIPKGEENVLPDWVKKVAEVEGCGCKNTFEKAVQILQN